MKGPYSRRLASIIAAAVLTAGMVAVNASPAQAAWGTCVSSYEGQPVVGCLYFHENGGGATFPVTTSQGCKNLPSYWNDVVSSLLNRTTSGYKLVVWRDSNCSGSSIQRSPGSSFGTLTSYWNDATSSYAVYKL